MSSIASNSAISDLMLQPESNVPKKNELGEDEFLRLMLAQLSAQDPFQPMENGEFIAQMAQFSSVQGINEMAESMAGLSQSFEASQLLQAASLVGHEVSINTNTATLAEETPINGGFELAASTGAATVRFHDAVGNLVHEQYLGELPAGSHSFAWDGELDVGQRASDGDYTVTVEYSLGDGYAAAEVFIDTMIDSVNFGAGGHGYVLNTREGLELGILDIRHIK